MSGLPRGGFGGRERPGRRRVFILGAIVIFLVIGWTYGVLSYDRAHDGDLAPRQTSSPDARGEPQVVPDDSAYVTAPEEQQQHSASTPERPVEGPPGMSASAPGELPEGARNEPGSHDPLGTGASADELAEIDQERVRFAAARFVSAAYGYSGRDEDAYNQGVGATVVWPVFYESEGAAEIERYAARVGETGTKSGALLTSFEVEETTRVTVSGYALFETGAGYGPNGELTGEKLAYRQHMTLERSDATWSVRATDKIEET